MTFFAPDGKKWRKMMPMRDLNTYPTFVAMTTKIPPAYPGFLFQVDTGNHQPICCKLTMYVPHKSEVMQKLVEWLYKNGVAEED